MNSSIEWLEAGAPHAARWRSEAAIAPHAKVVVGDDRLGADAAYRLLADGTAILWRGDWQNARQLLQALTQRADRQARTKSGPKPATPAAAFAQHRRSQGRRAALLGLLLVPLAADYSVPLRRAQDVRQACLEAYGPGGEDSVVALRELLAVVSAHEWRKKGIPVPAVEGRIYPHFGVFSPVRGEYVDLVATASLPAACQLAFDIGTGSGILAAVLARRGIKRILATDQDQRALQCASENVQKLGLSAAVEVIKADLFPAGQAPLVVCNPPWVPAQPSSPIEYAVYDPDSRMLRGFLGGLAAHLAPGGEGWLIISDLAEHLGLRTRAELLGWIAAAGLAVLGRLDTRPQHPKASDRSDPLHAARAAEVTSLWRLGLASG
ncbi:50S ribosomal protein L11 methyltransferase [Dechloromonas denitrificans]|uniref:50S ribosomal protein L11 methyltransferase n=1 Tax=Dechloromonas denitrificans TaxID=281362 RepID=UPI001CFB6797|nr:class I SAM-dependent methyltransferase [Dechloromonas denitrificans]UCV08612.1 class I SAM-dependent methyltransferase [Dechloromonas denitrificans]